MSIDHNEETETADDAGLPGVGFDDPLSRGTEETRALDDLDRSRQTGKRRPQKRAPWNDPCRPMEIIWINPDDLSEQPRRVRKAVKAQEKAVARAIERFGFRIPILIDGGYHVIDGHTRLAAARLLGLERVPCIVVDDLSAVEIRRLALSLNKLQEVGQWDETALKLEINDIIEIDEDLEFPGFDLPEIEAIRFGEDNSDTVDPADDRANHVAPSAPSVSRPGDLWRLGDHRVLCGSARDGDAFELLLAGETVDAVFTDPPYNVRINGHVRGAAGGFEEFAEASGEMSPAEFTTFLTGSLGHAARTLRPGGILFACMDWRHVSELSASLEALALDLLNICVWVKSNPGMGSLYRSQHEFVFVARKSGDRHRNNVQLGKFGRNRSNVWTYAGATGGRSDMDDDFAVHPTVKPIRMVRDALLDVTEPGDLILDPFLGSGSTLLAAERCRRCCAGIEIDPRYVDLTIRRWQDMTGADAVHAETRLAFAKMEAIRSTQASRRAEEISGTDHSHEEGF